MKFNQKHEILGREQRLNYRSLNVTSHDDEKIFPDKKFYKRIIQLAL